MQINEHLRLPRRLLMDSRHVEHQCKSRGSLKMARDDLTHVERIQQFSLADTRIPYINLHKRHGCVFQGPYNALRTQVHSVEYRDWDHLDRGGRRRLLALWRRVSFD